MVQELWNLNSCANMCAGNKVHKVLNCRDGMDVRAVPGALLSCMMFVLENRDSRCLISLL